MSALGVYRVGRAKIGGTVNRLLTSEAIKSPQPRRPTKITQVESIILLANPRALTALKGREMSKI